MVEWGVKFTVATFDTFMAPLATEAISCLKRLPGYKSHFPFLDLGSWIKPVNDVWCFRKKLFGVQNLYSWISISYRTILLSYPTIVSFGFSLCLQLFSRETSPSFFSIHNMVSFIFIHSRIWVWISYHPIVILKMRPKLIFLALKDPFPSLIRYFRLRGTNSFRRTPFQIADWQIWFPVVRMTLRCVL